MIFLILALQGPSEEELLRRRMEASIERGADYLQAIVRKGLPACPSEVRRYDELVLYALLHAGTSHESEAFKKLEISVATGPYDRTYTVALRAMALEALDRTKYKPEIATCAQYLVDQQAEDGRWGYGLPMKFEKPVDVESKTSTQTKRIIKRVNSTREKTGDCSNAQYAMLGLRACLKAGVEIDPAVFEESIRTWERDQRGDGGWGYGRESMAGDDSYGSMTAGGVASLIIAREALKKPVKGDPRIAKGLEWLDKNWSVVEHPKHPDPGRWFHYWLYAVERVGDLLGQEKIGDHEWFAPIRKHLIESQKKDGSWMGTDEMPIADTCFSILVLRRATKVPPKTSTGGK